jgi:mRNA-degrading endonuclease toxin of MazEF toxin-antitoxin module
VKRGEISTVAGGKDYPGKPRPAVIVQDDGFDATHSISICAFTTDETDARYSACHSGHRAQWPAGDLPFDV